MILNARGKQLYQVINAWNVSTANLESVISSLAHMTVNRVFPDRQREHEMIIYHFLEALYDPVEKSGRELTSIELAIRLTLNTKATEKFRLILSSNWNIR